MEATSLRSLKGVGTALYIKLQAMGLHTVDDLLQYWPRRYDDYSQVVAVAAARPGQVVIKAKIHQAVGRYVRRGMHVTEALATDATGSVRLVWFNQPYRAGSIAADHEYYIRGEYGLQRNRMCITSPAIERADSFALHTARIVPIYRESKGVTSQLLRKLLSQIVHAPSYHLPESLPKWLIIEQQLMDLTSTVRAMHFPADSAELAEARHRAAFEEVFRLTLASLLAKQENQLFNAPPISFELTLAKRFVAALPFKLSDDQRRVLWRILQDIQLATPMNRLVEGDVGSGKTVVAALTAAMSLAAGYQVAYMAPTELLARQVAETLHQFLQSLGQHNALTLLIGSLKPAQKKLAHAHLASGEAGMAIGTHALFTDKVTFKRLGLVIIDEQHRFGVEQRKKLQQKAHLVPHVLSMTATPIPRSLALTLYGELDISVLASKPQGRLPIKTTLVSPNAREQLYQKLASELTEGRQMYIVCPAISADGEVGRSVEQVYKELAKTPLQQFSRAMLHGKLKSDEKEQVMKDFYDNKIAILVATTVIEVGVHVANASVMVIESAERFGLAQMHQLRGRVGRSDQQGYCYVLSSDSKAPNDRLRAFATTTDGFKLSELDLALRGPGAIYGALQHGALDLRIANLSDTKLIAQARNAAAQFIERGENLLHYAQLAESIAQIRSVTYLN